jgi:hypothetical protein
MSVAAKPIAPVTDLERAKDTYRFPKVRHAMHMLVPRLKMGAVVEGKLIVTELKDAVQISLDVDNDGLGVKSLNLSLSEAMRLTEMLHAVRRKVVERQRNGHRP